MEEAHVGSTPFLLEQHATRWHFFIQRGKQLAPLRHIYDGHIPKGKLTGYHLLQRKSLVLEEASDFLYVVRLSIC